MPTYQVNITMPGDTVTALMDNGFNLYGFQVVQSSAGGSPVAWFKTTDFALTTAITWEVGYQAFTSRSQIRPTVQIVAEASYPTELGQVLTVSNAMGIGEVAQGTPLQTVPSGISILNTTSTQFTCGLQQQQPGGAFGPICAFPLFGNNMDVIVPIEQVYLMFSSMPINTGSVVEQAYGPGITINLTGSPTQTVAYDINGGWSWADNASWAQKYPPNQSLVPLIIQPLATLGPQ
jgi:hypothetical protein